MTAAALLAMVGVISAEAGARLAADDEWDPAQVVELLDDALRVGRRKRVWESLNRSAGQHGLPATLRPEV